MNNYFKVAKYYSVLNHFIVGLIATIFTYFWQVPHPEIMLPFGCIWIIGYVILRAVKADEKAPKYLFCILYDAIYLAQVATISVLFQSDTLFYGLCVLVGVQSFLYFDKVVIYILLAFQMVALSIYAMLVVHPSIIGIIGFVVFFLIAGWLFVRYLDIFEKQANISKNHRQSLDDMLQLVDEKYEEASQATKAKSQFLANMSHEIRTPINAILGLNTMIMRESEEDSIKTYAQDIDGSSKTLLSLINDILDISKIESGKMEIIEQKYRLPSLLNDVINMISIKAEDKGLALQVDVEETLPSELIGDDVRIKQILINILNNAVKYTPKGSITLQIAGECEGSSARLKFAIADTGVGIKEEDMDKLFDSFSRIDEKRNHQIEGTGLGMSITTNLLALMNSELEVDSVYGEGSTFRFTLVQKIVNEAPIGDLKKRIKESKEKYTYKEKFIAPQAKVLVVDDNDINRQVFKGLLRPLQLQIEEADGGAKALALTENTKYDLIFLDHMMPEMDGIETLQRMRQQEEGKNQETYVVALTANAIGGAKEMYLEAGFQNYLSKPIDAAKLEDLLDEVLPAELKQKAQAGSKTEQAQSEKQEETIEFPLIEGVDWAAARLHLPDDEMILEIVKAFYYTVDDEADYLETMYQRLVTSQMDEEALSSYRIKVHAMKSTSYMFGAFPIAGMAATLEFAARDEDLDYILTTTPYFLVRWRAYKEKLKALVADGDASDKVEVTDKQEIVQKVHALQEAIEAFDMHAGDALMEELKGYAFSEEVEALLEEMAGAVMNFDADKVRSLGDEMISKL
ncbi:MAG: response regulator [Lachnospiraceae bacterium]|nr:response regulator [Lachnospiraceae bacterium]